MGRRPRTAPADDIRDVVNLDGRDAQELPARCAKCLGGRHRQEELGIRQAVERTVHAIAPVVHERVVEVARIAEDARPWSWPRG